MASKRPGLQTVFQLSRELRTVFEPALDVLMRITGVTTTAITTQKSMQDAPLDPTTATAAQIAAQVNAMQIVLNNTIDKLNALIARIQED